MPDPVERVVRLIARRPARLGGVRLVAVDGPSGSGKTTFADSLRDRLAAGGIDTGVVSVDLLTTWDDPFGWWPVLEHGLLRPLATGRPGAIRANDWSGGRPVPGELVPIPVPQVLILEGVSAGRRAVADRTSVLVWVEVPGEKARLERAVRRDGEDQRQYLLAWQRAESEHFRADGTAARADVLIDPTG